MKARGVAEEENLSLFALHPKIVVAQGLRIDPPLVPPVQDFDHFVPLPQINKSPGAFLALVTGIRFYLDVLKDPFHKAALSKEHSAISGQPSAKDHPFLY